MTFFSSEKFIFRSCLYIHRYFHSGVLSFVASKKLGSPRCKHLRNSFFEATKDKTPEWKFPDKVATRLKGIFVPILLFFVLGTIISCSSLLYYPTDFTYVDKGKLPVVPEDGFFFDDSGQPIHYWRFKSKKPKAQILYFHGNAQNLTAHFAMLAWIVDFNYDFIIFDYPGYGKSKGQPTPESTVKSGLAALTWASQTQPNLPLITYGQSLGGQIMQKSLNLFEMKKIKAVFIEGSFLSYRSVAKSVLNKSYITWLLQPIGWLAMSDTWAGDPSLLSPTPTFVIHGTQDEVVPISQGHAIFEKSNAPKEWIEVPDSQHNNLYFIKNGFYRTMLLEKLETLFRH